MSKKKNKPKVLRFEQSDEFYYNKYLRCVSAGEYFDALGAIRRAIELSPDELEYRYALAELFTEMALFEESNAVLFELMNGDKLLDADCLIGMGCNFLGLSDYQHAKESFQRFVDLAGDDESDEARDFLELVEETEGSEEQQRENYIDTFIIETGEKLLKSGSIEDAVPFFESALKTMPKNLNLKNNLALACFYNKDTERAKKLTEEILRRDRDNIFALCNKAVFENAAGNKAACDALCARVMKLHPDDIDEMQKAASTFYELKRYELAYETAADLISATPYDADALHSYAACCAMTGRSDAAIFALCDIMRIYPDDTISPFYISVIKNAVRDETLPEIEYMRRVPYEELCARLRTLFERAHLTVSEQFELFKKDDEYRRLLLWALYISNEQLKQTAVMTLALFDCPETVRIFRRYLLCRDESDDIKQLIAGILAGRNVPPPYLAYICGKISELRPNDGANGWDEPVAQELSRHETPEDDEWMPTALDMLEEYANERPAVRIKSPAVWAASIEYLARIECDEAQPQRVVANKYGVSAASLPETIRKLREVLYEPQD